jgi:hypothetical protein
MTRGTPIFPEWRICLGDEEDVVIGAFVHQSGWSFWNKAMPGSVLRSETATEVGDEA